MVEISDVSEYQGDIDWSKVPPDVGIYHRLWAWRPNELRRDAKVDFNVSHSGLDRLEGGYLRVNPVLWSPRYAAQLLFDECDRQELLRDECLRPAVDIEPTADAQANGRIDWPAWTRGFFAEWRALTTIPLRVYTSGSFFDSLLGGVEDWPEWVDCWVAHTGVPAGQPKFTTRAVLHQYSFTGRRPGIAGDVDMDVSMPGVTTDDLIIKKAGTAVARQMDLSPNRSSRGGATVRLIAVHTAEGSQRKESLGAYFRNPAVEASSHDGGDAFGLLGYVPYEEKAWTLLNGNPISDNLELCAFATMTREQWMSEVDITYYHTDLKRDVTVYNPKALLKWCAAWIRERCLARNIPIKKIDAAAIKRGESGVIGHIDWTLTGDGSHTDPGPNFPWDYVISLANNSGEDDMGLTPEQDARLTTIYNFLGLTAGAPVNPDTGKRATMFEVVWGQDELIVGKLGPLFKDVLDAVKAVPGGEDVSTKLDEVLQLASVGAETLETLVAAVKAIPANPNGNGQAVVKLSDVTEALENVFRRVRMGFPPAS